MTFKRIFLFIWLSVFFHIAQAQKVTYAQQELDAYSYDYIKTAGYNDNSFFVFQSNLPFENDRDRVGFKSRKYRVTCFNRNLSLKWSKKIELKGEKEKLETITVINGQVALIKSSFEGKDNQISVYITTLDDNGNESSTRKDIGTILFNRTSNLDKIKVIASKGNNYFGLIQNEKKQNGFQQLHCLIIDSDFKLVRQLQFEVPYPEKNFNYENWLLTDDADFILEGSYYSKEKSENRKRWDAYKLFVSSNGNSGAIEYAINTSNLILSSSAIAYDAINKKLVLAAFYTDNVSTKSGIVYASLGTAANDSLLMIRQPIGDATLTRMFAGQNLDRSSAGIENLSIEKLILRNDGGAVLVTEVSYVTDYSYYDYFTQNYIRNFEYHFNNVITFSINPDGTIDWDAVLRKEQVSTNDYGKYSSFALAMTESDISLLYNTRTDRNNGVAYFGIKRNGETESKEIIKPEERILLVPFAAKQISTDEIVVPCWNRKKMLMAKITF
ncbi:MAG TPA: hypothetical protein PLQ16_05595 [Bacteroidia bacterium]|nr:hypothetical protein [Bacteroidia bacterium]